MESVVISLFEKYSYLSVFFSTFLENVFPPIPSGLILVFSGFMLTKITINTVLLIIVSVLGSILGSLVLYYIGTIFTEAKLIQIINSKYGKIFNIKTRHIKNANNWFKKHGKVTVLIFRVIPIFKSLISLPAGINKMKLTTFLIYTLIGTIIWNTTLILMGKLLGDNWYLFVAFINNVSSVLLYVVVIILIIMIIVIKRGSKND